MSEFDSSSSNAILEEPVQGDVENVISQEIRGAVPEETGGNDNKENRPVDNLTATEDSQQQVVDVSGIWTGTEKKEDLSKFQMIASGFFAQTREPALTINGKIITVNAAAARLFPEVDYMEILINPDEKKVAFKPCDELNISGYKWARSKNGKRYATQRTGLPFVLCVCEMMGWNPDNRYRILGKKIKSLTDEEILLFDLNAKQEFKRASPGEGGKKSRSTILTGWNGTFGPTYDENKGSLHMDTFKGYTVMSIQKKGQKALPLSLEQQEETAENGEKP